MSRMIGKKRRLYSQASLIEAAKLVEDNELSLNKAAKVFGIPKTSLHDKVRFSPWFSIGKGDRDKECDYG